MESQAGQETCCGRAFSHGTGMYSPSLGIPWQRRRAPWKQRTGSAVLSPYTDISQGKHAVQKRRTLRIDILTASPHWSSNIGQHFPFGFFGYWLSFLGKKKEKCQGLCHASLFLYHLRTIHQAKTDPQLKHLAWLDSSNLFKHGLFSSVLRNNLHR